jgi:hypothetical protein
VIEKREEENTMEEIRKPPLLTFCMLVMGVSVVFGIRAVGASIDFFQEPIPCKIYLEKKNIFEEKIEKGHPYVSGSFFQAKVQIIGEPIGPEGGYKNKVRVVDVLEGASPATEFVVHYSAIPGHGALPNDHKDGNFYFIMGGLKQTGEVLLFSVESDFDGKTISGYKKPHWAIAWFYQLFSECENV